MPLEDDTRLGKQRDFRAHDGYASSSTPQPLGFIEPDCRYRHGTLSGYSAGKCRCQHCKDIYADYRARRREAGKDSRGRRRTINTDGHIPRTWFRDHVWKPTIKAADLRIHLRPHDLRHAHASWLLAGGADLQAVKERLGHASITTTEKYLHTLPDEDDSALDAFDKIRNRSKPASIRAV
ncbi:tyrosine-type recombinase/integrase [Actinomadura madurae]|uniref:tyrosine-type recombinase/integrase n=1 Tax=Actinomadura madurae TaxID=1993 RepID=UPI003559215A